MNDPIRLTLLCRTCQTEAYYLVTGTVRSAISIDNPAIVFWSKDPIYSKHLLTPFEHARSHAVSAKDRIQELEQKAGQRWDSYVLCRLQFNDADVQQISRQKSFQAAFYTNDTSL